MLAMSGCLGGTEIPGDPIAVLPAPPALHHAELLSADEVFELADEIRVENGVMRIPNLGTRVLPPDLDLLPVDDKKAAFLHALLPLVIHENERIAADRRRLLQILDGSGTATPADASDWILSLMTRYRIPHQDAEDPDFLHTSLLRRVDVIPVSLVLSQAAIESAWGTSRFALEGNALFGQWTFDPTAPGIVPEGREAGATHRVAAFDDLVSSIRAYMRNLNTNRAYAELRSLRLAQRRSSADLDPFSLSETLTLYSARGMDYVEEVQEILRREHLARYDTAELRPASLDLLTRFSLARRERARKDAADLLAQNR
jgi:Bax protein